MATIHFNKESFQNEVLNKKELPLWTFGPLGAVPAACSAR